MGQGTQRRRLGLARAATARCETQGSNSYPGGGGYNELMFDDTKGDERVSMQAERDRGVTERRRSVSAVPGLVQLIGSPCQVATKGILIG